MILASVSDCDVSRVKRNAEVIGKIILRRRDEGLHFLLMGAVNATV